MRALSLAMLVACSGSPDPIASPSNATVHRATPAPRLAWATHGFVTDAFPTVARAGELVVIAATERDGERGYPNLRLEVRDRGDHTVQTIQVLNSNEYEQLAPGGTPGKTLLDRIAAANTELVKLHDLHDLVAMNKLEVQPASDNALAHLAIGDGLDVDWGGDHLHIFRHNSDRAVAIRDARGWQAPTHNDCDYPAFLANAYHVPEITVIVVELAYRSPSDMCGVPSDQLHVVTW
ncbi:MAG: hypothetical protein ABI591_19965 [Kofleriaceae bacterium]